MADNDRWLTVDELAVLRGIDRSSAQRLVRRKKWRKQSDNQGTVRILVPDTAVQPETIADVVRSLKALEAAVTAGNAAIERERERADQAEATIATERAARTAAEAAIEQAAVDLATEQVARATAEAAADALRSVEAERQARGLLARLAAAVRGE